MKFENLSEKEKTNKVRLQTIVLLSNYDRLFVPAKTLIREKRSS